MEVHHHAHHEGKKSWKSYIWEFLMLFLAVFCGFMAEWQLEHVIEHQREKEYMHSIVEDIKEDVATEWSRRLTHCDFNVKHVLQECASDREINKIIFISSQELRSRSNFHGHYTLKIKISESTHPYETLTLISYFTVKKTLRSEDL